jgi:hypothetical protein
MSKMKGLSHESIKAADDAAKAEKDAPKRPDYRHFLSRLNVSSFGKNDDELPRIVKEQLQTISEFFDAYPAEKPGNDDTSRGDVAGHDRMNSGGRNR